MRQSHPDSIVIHTPQFLAARTARRMFDMSVCLSFCLSMYVCLCVCVAVCRCVGASVCLFICVSMCLCVYVSMCLCVCVAVWLCGYVAVWLCVCVSVAVCLWLCGFVAVWLCFHSRRHAKGRHAIPCVYVRNVLSLLCLPPSQLLSFSVSLSSISQGWQDVLH